MNDTSPSSLRRYRELLARLSPAERAAIAMSLNRAVRQVALAGIRAMHPGASEREISAHLAERLYGAEVAERLFGRVP